MNMILRIANWEKEKPMLRTIRHEVFITEQLVPEEMEWDEFDDSATHFLCLLEGKVIATARLKPDGQIGRMAVLKDYRGFGYGNKLLVFVIQTARKKNIKKLYLHAQVSAIAFYEKQGFSVCSDIFYEANIPHREMSKIFC
ncbi:hypothetical protein MNBD_GAMMA05-1396 [hydrothermal vent metagenome]|uniref:N-acetyltransferase domain-containing protein n=1 Tax=hydrothermal vent metagenome TaxID=652676 RepID=A0A3B0W3F6_9ZZZZ